MKFDESFHQIKQNTAYPECVNTLDQEHQQKLLTMKVSHLVYTAKVICKAKLVPV